VYALATADRRRPKTHVPERAVRRDRGVGIGGIRSLMLQEQNKERQNSAGLHLCERNDVVIGNDCGKDFWTKLSKGEQRRQAWSKNQKARSWLTPTSVWSLRMIAM
jgi:hypothetical protein